MTAITPPPPTPIISEADPLPHQRTFRTRDLGHAREYLRGVLNEGRLSYLPRERLLNFHHRQAKLGSVAINFMQFGAGIMVNAPPFIDFYMLQFTLSGRCQIWQGKNHTILPAASVAILNPFRPFAKAWMPESRQLFFKIDKRLVEREFRAWTGNDDTSLEFDQAPISDMARVGTLARYAQMLCDDLRHEMSHLAHPLVGDRIASGLASLLLTSIPHNKMRAFDAATSPAAPCFVRRVEQFIGEHACDPIALEDLAHVAGVSIRALQLGFRRFRDTTPMAHLRATRLELARRELVRAARHGGSVAGVANAFGFAHLGRFARDYKARFGEPPSHTISRGSAGPTRWQDGDD